jgi:hypothetical protein
LSIGSRSSTGQGNSLNLHTSDGPDKESGVKYPDPSGARVYANMDPIDEDARAASALSQYSCRSSTGGSVI